MPVVLSVGDLLSCCASKRWATEVAAQGPFPSLDSLERVSAEVLAGVDWADVRAAIDAHPRIGERVTGADREAAWSRDEQSAAAVVDERVRAELVDGNVRYEKRFGHVFLICATGLSAGDVLSALRARLGNDDAVEREIVRAELAKIVGLRLRKLVDR
ncbi:2-oxo-4-hydroxy-4-carboxy-5-ureidoimidazoline decarboxylase [Actinokineospora iranica]|uniref:2-oxo-4-hydroxy-4-carboxy-5-ureidoimidazoline decarboxylase n=1 Tax=Actinokineospora iranica TaxID=1271860 RepID=A0A1G6LG92_9PSEU|nr:2-oxo-4-hydroxy-4-carboxy-5-ureidoimidazoline decarboxylase [Actinokineospora iranica]